MEYNSEFVGVEKFDDIIVFKIKNPPVNALSMRMVEPLVKFLQQANKDKNVSAMVITGNDKFFVSGADIKEFSKLGQNKGPTIPEIFDIIEDFKKPVVMALNGFALGGGLELAMSGHYRLALPSIKVGLVELKIGLLPGAGGTQRLPRLIGAKRATEIMLFGEEIKATEAKKLGLIDQIVENEKDLVKEAVKAAKNLIGKNLKVSSKISFENPEKEVEIVKNILNELDKAGKTRNQIHFKLCAESIISGINSGYKEGIKTERNNFMKCLMNPNSRGLMNIFFAQRQCSNVPGITDRKDLKPLKINSVAVLGGGTMGSGIIIWLLTSGVKVVLKEVNEKYAEAASKRINGFFEDQIKRKRITEEIATKTLKNFKIQTTYDDFDKLDMVIEAIFEDIELKQKTFIDLEKYTNENCILASNTSTISIETIGEKVKCRDRIIGVHFFSPANIMPLVEIIRGLKTSDLVILSTLNFIKNNRKTVVLVRNCVGFLVNRIFAPAGVAARFLVDQGVDVYRIDKVMYDFGMAMGTFRTSDLSGNDVGKFIQPIFQKAYGHRFIQSSLINHMVDAGRLGEKSGKGFYKYEGRKALKDDDIYPIIEKSRKDSQQLYPNLPKTYKFTDEDIINMIQFSIINESCRCLDEKIAIRSTDIDVCSVFGMGYPSYRGGVMTYGKTVGFKKIVQTLNNYYDIFGLDFFKPCEYLQSLADGKSKL